MDNRTSWSSGRTMEYLDADDLGPINNASPFAVDAKCGFKSTEETMAELRRENFRLRLILFDYQKAKKRLIDPQDAESSRLFAAEAENLSLKEALNEKADLIRSASKMIDILKDENDSFKEQLKEARERLEANEKEWRKKYDEVYTELVQVREALHISELKARAQEHASAKQTGELQSQIVDLQFTVDAGQTELNRKTRELDSVQAEVSKLRSALEQLHETDPRVEEAERSMNDLSRNMHDSCLKRVQELASVVHLLIRQITDAGLTPATTVPLDLPLNFDQAVDRKPLGELSVGSNQAGATQQMVGIPKDASPAETVELTHLPGTDAAPSVSWLTDRLNAARQLILELGNQKLKQDDFISQLKLMHGNELDALKENYHSIEEQLQKQKVSYETEAAKRAEEIQNLNQRIAHLLEQAENEMKTRGKLLADVDQAQEQIRRLEGEKTEVRERLTAELQEKEHVIQRLQLVLSVVGGNGDVTQHTIHNETCMLDSFAHDTGARGEARGLLRGLSPQQLTAGDGDGGSFMQQILLSSAGPNEAADDEKSINPHSSRESPHHVRSVTFSLDVAPGTNKTENPDQHSPSSKAIADQTAANDIQGLQQELSTLRQQLNKQIEDYSRLKKAYDILATTTNIGSLASEAITSIDVTHDLAQLSNSSSLGESMGDLPTVSTPPCVSRSPVFDEHSNLDELVANQSSAGSPADVSDRGVSCVTLDVEQDQVANVSTVHGVTSTSLVFHSRNRFASGLSTSCVGQPLSIETVLNLSLPGTLGADNEDSRRLPHNSPVIHAGQPAPHFEPQSLAGLRTLYSLIHGLKMQLDEVRFTQHSFVEMVNRSLSAVMLDTSSNESPEKSTEAHKTVGVGTSILSPADLLKETSKNSPQLQISKADATYGGAETILENMQPSFLKLPDSDVDLDRSTMSVPGLNKTLGELRAYPGSPAPRGQLLRPPQQPNNTQRRIASIMKSKNPLARLRATHQAASVSWCDDAPTQPVVDGPHPLSVSLNMDDRSDLSRASSRQGLERSLIGDLSLVEWQNKELFERLARATAKLRNALDECVEASSQLWAGEAENSLAKLFHNTLDISQQTEEEDRKTPEPAKPDWNASGPVPNQSAQFDGVHPHMDSVRLSNDISFSHLFGPSWPAAPDSSSSEKTDQKVSTDTQTLTSKRTTTTATSTTTTTQAFSDPTDVVMLQRYVALLTHALSVLRRTISDAIQQMTISSTGAPSSDTGPHWLVSWVQSATHWFHSYLDSEATSDRSKATLDSATAGAAEKDDIESLLECLERVFNDRIDEWVRDTKQHVVQLATALTTAQTKNEELSSAVHRLENEVKQLSEENRLAESKCEELRNELDNLLAEQDSNLRAELSQSSVAKSDQQSMLGRLGRIFHVAQSKHTAATVSSKREVVEAVQSDSLSGQSAFEQEREAVLQLLKSSGFEVTSSLSCCVESIVTELEQTREQCSRLTTQLTDSVPLSDYQQLKDDSHALHTRLTQIEHQRAYIKQRLELLNFEVDPSDFTDCVDLLLSELSALRNNHQQLTRENSHLLNKLESSVPKQDYEDCQNRINALVDELRQLQDRFQTDHRVTERAISLLAPLAPAPVEPCLTDLVEWLANDLNEQRSAVEQFRHDQNQAISMVSALSDADSLMSLSDCLELLYQKLTETQTDLTEMRSEREKTLHLLKDVALGDRNSLFDQAKSVVSSLTQKQQELNDLREHYAKNSVPSAEYAKIQSDLEFVCDELEQCRFRADEFESERNELLRTSVPLEEHQQVLQQLEDLEKHLDETKYMCDTLTTQQRQIRHLISQSTASQEDNLVRNVEMLCEQLAEHQQLVTSLETRYNTVVTDCENLKQQVAKGVAELDKRSELLKYEYETQLHTTREEFEGKLSQCRLENQELGVELNRNREKIQELNNLLDSRQAESDCLLEQLAEMEEELRSVRSSLRAKNESVQAALEAAAAHEERANALASQLDCLREEHAHCMDRPATVSTQTSPVCKAKSAEEVNVVDQATRTLRPDLTEATDPHNLARSRKYGELKAVAFEIKEKLVQRTNKLESALTEVARLRSVIQQDKEHASRVLEEVEDLRKQAVRKNKKIRELETEVSRLRSLIPTSGNPQPVIGAPDTRSSARTASQREQPRGAQYRVTLDGSLTSSFPASLLQHPETPTINYPDFERELSVEPISLATPISNSPDQIPERETVSVTRAASPPCKRCEQLCHVAVNLQRLSSELQRHVTVDLDEEISFLDSLERQTVPTQTISSAVHSTMASHQQDGCSGQVSMASVLSSSVDELKLNIQSLHHARSRLQHYAGEVDRICSILVRRSNQPAGRAPVDNASSAELEAATATITRSFDSLSRIRHQLKSFLREMNLSGNSTGKQILSELRTVIQTLRPNGSSLVSTDRSLENISEKENVAPLNPIQPNGREDGWIKQAQKYRRQYRELARGLDSMAKELSQTTNVLTATRTNLERTTGLSVSDASPISARLPSPRTN